MYKYHLKSLLFLYCVCTFFVAAAQKNSTVTFSIDINNKAQVIDNIGSSGCWFSEGIGKFWPQEKKERIAELLFSKAVDAKGNPKGIGLSCWRFNIGGGTEEQGDSSGIKDFRKRAECFLLPDGSYDWSKQSGYKWFVKKARDYGVERLIAFSNTPPVQYTQNGLGYKTVKDYKTNLKADKFRAYTDFLAEVVKQFDKEGLHFDYISPVNEPQWDWSRKYMDADQEGTPWTNEEINLVIKSLDSSLEQRQRTTKILFGEAGMLSYLYGNNGNAARQIQQFYAPSNKLYVGNLKHVPPVIAAHSYFTDTPDSTMISIRKQVADTAEKYGASFWQSEYCMLADGYKEGAKESRTAMDCALFLSKVIYQDFTAANAAAWQFWNAYEPGIADADTRYYLIALKPNATHTDGSFTATKNLWALGHYSLFVRPGMQRIPVKRDDGVTDLEAAQQLMVASFANDKTIVTVAINYSKEEKRIKLNMDHFGKVKSCKRYTTTAAEEENMKAYPQVIMNEVILPARSISTVVVTK